MSGPPKELTIWASPDWGSNFNLAQLRDKMMDWMLEQGELPAPKGRNLFSVSAQFNVQEVYGTCDWGQCDAEATEWRWSENGEAWLPVCREHRLIATEEQSVLTEGGEG